MPKKYVKTKQNERRAVCGFASIREGGLDDSAGTSDADVPFAFVDTLTNLMHFAEQHGHDFDDLLRIARGHFEIERTGEED
jgi:hypothetical protein